MKRSQYPVLRGTITSINRIDPSAGILTVWCPVCRDYHEHGWTMADSARRPSHRVAHCAGGPFHEHGYLVAPWRQSDPEAVAHVAVPGRGKR